ncbi:hypothetical protein [Deinococcus wulumuqiensis]|uniref:GIY-YIG domain-containing protein n=1 Tax=Deinococcus wulumuqiensis TaxID=980427 RepID=A0AAV4K2L3_9DEIO|nr:hypothetical protein [Deinococcus wulumuqiensis]QII20226.1 hypothetical protein G6R31_05160 [Deinococcus wulumuqiensis R12]GGI75025.1 hypothetical protein GCM10010914_06540 [Deinococcus wulumuqiensis]GGP28670.1 hypothetical protein GCM10008021_03210 [Deinococcus wulumuqiensis]
MTRLVSHQEILRNTIPFDYPVVRGIYFLLAQRQIVYVGQSINCHNRVRMHLADKDFDSYAVLPATPTDDLNTLEALYILRFRPGYNLALPTTLLLISAYSLKRKKVSRFLLRKLTDDGVLEPVVFQGVTYYWRAEIEDAVERGLL